MIDQQLLTGFAEYLEDAGVDGVTMAHTPAAAPDRWVGLATNRLESDRATGRELWELSVRIRVPRDDADPTYVDSTALRNLKSQVDAALAPIESTTIGGVPVSMVEWWTEQPFSTDARGRPEVVVAYHVTCTDPARVAALAAQ